MARAGCGTGCCARLSVLQPHKAQQPCLGLVHPGVDEGGPCCALLRRSLGAGLAFMVSVLTASLLPAGRDLAFLLFIGKESCPPSQPWSGGCTSGLDLD